MSLRADPEVLKRAISRMVSTDSCFAVSMKEQVLTTRISASSGWAVRRAPARSSRPIMTSESTRVLGQPNEIKPTEGAVGGEDLVTVLLYRRMKKGVGVGFVVSHPCDRNKNIARMGHPAVMGRLACCATGRGHWSLIGCRRTSCR